MHTGDDGLAVIPSLNYDPLSYMLSNGRHLSIINIAFVRLTSYGIVLNGY